MKRSSVVMLAVCCCACIQVGAFAGPSRDVPAAVSPESIQNIPLVGPILFDVMKGIGTNDGKAPSDTLGACCLDDGCRITTPRACREHGGVFRGIGSTCDDCRPAVGACCVETPAGILACIMTTPQGCRERGGVYQGDGSTCTDASCAPPPIGACCIQTADGVRCVPAT
ncbi:MAG: hypothetical protein KDA32_10135, partial [Phycisphaerales bacterium]|nr:hypothetical protein [Phycisphaerales bacterium]